MFPFLLQSQGTSCHSLPQAQHEHTSRLSLLQWQTCDWVVALHPPASTCGQFCMMGHECPALHSRDCDFYGVLPSREWNFYHVGNVCMWETFLVHCSAESEGANKQLHITIPHGQHCCHMGLRFTPCIGCQLAQPNRKLLKYGMLVNTKCLCAHFPSDLWTVKEWILPVFAENISASSLSLGSFSSVSISSEHITKHFTCHLHYIYASHTEGFCPFFI